MLSDRLSNLRYRDLFLDAVNGDEDDAGEFLRMLTFDGWGYREFPLREGALPVTERVARELLDTWDAGPEEEDYPVHGCVWATEGETIYAAWYWDGDGTLLIAVYDSSDFRPIRGLANYDCKKDYGWHEVEAVAVASGNFQPRQTAAMPSEESA